MPLEFLRFPKYLLGVIQKLTHFIPSVHELIDHFVENFTHDRCDVVRLFAHSANSLRVVRGLLTQVNLNTFFLTYANFF